MKKFIIILLAVATLGVTSCEKWLDVNHNPNDATQASPELVLPGVLSQWLSDNMSLAGTAGPWMGYWYHAGGWSGGYELKKYDVSTSFYNAMGYYQGQLTDNKYIRQNCGDNVVYPALTYVVDAWYYARLVDTYGMAPYYEACSPELTFTPKYDDGQVIYNAIIHKLNVAIAAFDSVVNGKNASANPIYSFTKSKDIIYNGDFTKWAKFANTLKLRLVMRQTNVKSVAALKAEMDSTISYGFIAANVTGTPGYSISSGKTNPWYSTYARNYAGAIQTGTTTYYCLNSYMYRKLTLLADPRLTQFWTPGTAAAGVLIATPYGTDGDLVKQPNATKAGNYTWVLLANDWSAAAAQPNGLGHTDPTRIFLLSEAWFLQSEAALRGIITTVAPDVAYTNGITAAMADAKVATAARDTYLATGDVLWSAAWTTDQKIEHIINQKWIANFFLNMFESYSDYRRTNYPNPIHPAFTKTDPTDVNFEMLTYYPSGIIRRQIPRIFPFPQTEFDLNKTMVQAAVDATCTKYGVTFINTSYPFDARVFWDTAPKTITY
jgi:hypothetical protein